MSLKIGDVVQLKSGGPWMTVENGNYESNENKVKCYWFNRIGDQYEICFNWFYPDMLKGKLENLFDNKENKQ